MLASYHPSQALFLFSALIASLSVPMLVVDLLGDLYATTWWVPMADAGLQQWPGGWAVESAAAKAWLAHGAARPANASRAAAALATPALRAAAAAAAAAAGAGAAGAGAAGAAGDASTAQLTAGAAKATRAHGSGTTQGPQAGAHAPPHHRGQHGLLDKLTAPRADERPRGAASPGKTGGSAGKTGPGKTGQGNATRAAGR